MLSTVTTAAHPPQDTALFFAKAPSASTYTFELTANGPVWMAFCLRVLFGGELVPTWGAHTNLFYDLTAAIVVMDVELAPTWTSPPPSLSHPFTFVVQIIEMLAEFSTSPDKSMSFADFGSMMVAARLA
ncbi:hypothetical protein DFH07DRAFT_772051 [Mycena maculata]|uniref:Uncharacterized protein n=1 Tax=Mycena maculata TaxID=230809 RepID=A0AAD7NFB4_9AGAR|nr:hypothetical protein DFH07DRAFT_772051 [Mycena maculata]